MSATIRERLKAALEAKGWTQGPSQGGYWTLTHPERNFKWFLGQAGALRKGRSPSASRSATDSPYYKALLATEPQPGWASIPQLGDPA
jgi:hypothetical protein